MNPFFKQGLQADQQDEAEAVQNYGQRAKQAPPSMKPTFKGIQKQEKGHHSKVSKALAGLKAAGK